MSWKTKSTRLIVANRSRFFRRDDNGNYDNGQKRREQWMQGKKEPLPYYQKKEGLVDVTLVWHRSSGLGMEKYSANSQDRPSFVDLTMVQAFGEFQGTIFMLSHPPSIAILKGKKID
jgi:hypothetical protein